MFIDNFKIEDDKLVAYSRENPELEKELDELWDKAMKKWEEQQKEAINKAGYVMKCNQILKEVGGFRNV